MRLRLPAIGMAIALIVGACGGTTASPSASGPPASSAATSVPSTAASPSGASGESVLRVARLADHFNFFHPVQFQTGNQFQWWSSVFNTLIKVEADSKTVVGDLADDVGGVGGRDGTRSTWTPTRRGMTASRSPRTTWCSPSTGPPTTGTPSRASSPHWGAIAGAAAVAGTTNTPERLKKVDDHTVKITLVGPNAEFLFGLADMANVILPAHILKDATAADIETVPFTVGTPGVTVGTGPYKLAAFTPDQSVELEANADYFKGAPHIDRIVFKLFADPTQAIAQLESGDLDLAFRVPPASSIASRRRGPERHLGRQPGRLPNLRQHRRRRPGTRATARRSPTPSTSRPSSTPSTRVAPRCSTTTPGSRSTTTSTSTSTRRHGEASCWPPVATRASRSRSCMTAPSRCGRSCPSSRRPGRGRHQRRARAHRRRSRTSPCRRPRPMGRLHRHRRQRGAHRPTAPPVLHPKRPTPTNSNYTNPRIFELWTEGVPRPMRQRDAVYHELALILNTDLPRSTCTRPDLVMVATKASVAASTSTSTSARRSWTSRPGRSVAPRACSRDLTRRPTAPSRRRPLPGLTGRLLRPPHPHRDPGPAGHHDRRLPRPLGGARRPLLGAHGPRDRSPG